MITIPQPENFDTECLIKGISILLKYYPNASIYSEGGGEYYFHWTDSKEIIKSNERVDGKNRFTFTDRTYIEFFLLDGD